MHEAKGPLAALLCLGAVWALACSSPEAASNEGGAGTSPGVAGATASGGSSAGGSPGGSSSGVGTVGGVNAGGLSAGGMPTGTAGTANGGAAPAAGTSGAGGGGYVPPTPISCQPWPAAGATVELDATLEVAGVLDGGMKRYLGVGALAGEGQDEDMPPLMRLAPGTVLKNVVIGKPASDGIHCDGTCYLQNVWWEDVGEDAATLDGTDPTQTMTVECAGARHASDKVFQHNGPGTYVLTNVFVSDFNKMYRSCGNCLIQYERHARLSSIEAEDGQVLVGLNENYGDSVTFDDITAESGIEICQRFTGNDSGAEPNLEGSGADAEHCLYDSADIERP